MGKHATNGNISCGTKISRVMVVSTSQTRYWTDGCFDMMHYAHANALRQARLLCDELVVGIHSDKEITENKGIPVMNETER